MKCTIGEFIVPFFIRRTLGLRIQRRFPFDTTVKLRASGDTWVLTHPEDIRHVLVGNARNYIKTPFLTSAAGQARAGRGLLTSSGKAHSKQRRALQDLFHPPNLEPFTAIMVHQTNKLVDTWENGSTVNMTQAMSDLSLSILLHSLFGNEEADEYREVKQAIATRRRFTNFVYHSKLPFRNLLPTRLRRQNGEAVRLLTAFIESEIAKRRDTAQQQADLLSLLMTCQYGDGSTMTDRLLVDEVLTFTSTGYETLGEALAWTLYHLADDPGIENRLHKEVQKVLNGRTPEHSDLGSLPYCNMVFRESMRLHPPTWIFERVPLKEDRLPSGLLVPAHATLYLCQFAMHRHPGIFSEPNRFDPTRFEDAPRRAFRFAYFPFGDGAHACLGENYAMLQGVMALSCMALRFSFRLLQGQNIKPGAGITLYAKNGIFVKVNKTG